LFWKQENENTSRLVLPKPEEFDTFLETYIYSLFDSESESEIENGANELEIDESGYEMLTNETEPISSESSERFNTPNFLQNNTLWDKFTNLFNGGDEDLARGKHK